MWNSRSLLARLFLIVTGLLLFGLIVFSTYLSTTLAASEREQLAERLVDQARAVAAAVGPVPVARPDMFAGDDIRARITLIGLDGTVLADNRQAPSTMDNHRTRPEILAASTHDVGVSRRFSNTLGYELLYVAVPVRDAGRTVGYVRVATPTSVIEEGLAHLRNTVFLVAGTIGAAFMVVSYYLATSIARPIISLASSARRIAAGDFDHRLDATRRDEVGHLSRSLNELSAGIHQRITALTDNRNRLATILSGLQEGVIAVDTEQRVLHCNRAACELLAIDPGSEGRFLWEVTRILEIADAIDLALGHEARAERTLSVGGRKINLKVLLLNDATGDLTGAILVLEDVSEIEQVERARSDFVANASHELKTPIAAIRGIAETVGDDPDMDAAVRMRFIDRIRSQALRLEVLVSDLLQLSRFDGSQGRDGVRLVLRDVVSSVVDALRQRAQDAGVVIDVVPAPEPLAILGEREAIEQLVHNLVENAISYSAEDGHVRITTERDGRFAVLAVTDDGIGIAPADQRRIFERFYRVDKNRSRLTGGTGLGLAIVKHIAQSHRGSVSVESSLGEGSTFSVRVPAWEEDEAASG